MKFLWCCIVLAVLNYSECQLVHTPVHYVAVTPAPKFYYSTASPFQQSPIHVTIENDIIYADKEQQQPGKPTIISRTFHGNPNYKTLPSIQQQQQPIPVGNQNTFIDSFNAGSQTVSLEHDQDVNIHALYDQGQNTQNHQQQPQGTPATTKKPKTPTYRHHKYEVRRPAIKKQFYDVEEIVRIRPVGSTLIELDQPVSNTQPQEQLPAKNQTKSDPIAEQMREDIDVNKLNGNQQFFNYEFVAQNNSNNNDNKQKQENANGNLPPQAQETPDYSEDVQDEEFIEKGQEQQSTTTPASLPESDYSNNDEQSNNDHIPQYDYDEDSVVIEADPSADYPSTRGAVRTHINETSKQLEFGARINKLSRASSDTSANPRALNCDHPPQSEQRSSNYGHYLNSFGYFPQFGSRVPNQFVPETPEEAEYIPQGPTVSQPPQQPPQQPQPQPPQRPEQPQQPGVFVQYFPQGRRVPTYTPQYYPNVYPQYVPQGRSQPGFGYYPNYYPQYVPQQPQPQPQQPRQYPQQPREQPQPQPQPQQPREQPQPQPQPHQPRQYPQQPREQPQPQPQPQHPRQYPQQPREQPQPQPQPQQPRQYPQQPREQPRQYPQQPREQPQPQPQPQQPRQYPQQPRQYPQQPREQPQPQPQPQQPRQYPQQPQPEQPVYIPQRPSFDPLPDKPAYIPQRPLQPINPSENDQPIFIPQQPQPQPQQPRQYPQQPIPAGPTHVPDQQPTYVRPVGFYPQQPTDRPQYGSVSPRFRPRFQTTTSEPFVEGTEEPDLNQFLNNNANSSPEEDEENQPAQVPEIPSVETTSNGEAGNKDQSTGIVVSRPDTVDDAQNNQRNYIRLLTERQNIAEVGFGGQQCGHPNHDGSEHINAGVVRTRVISATPAPKTAKTGERISHRRIVISTPVETVQEIDVIEPVNDQEEDKVIPESRSATTTTAKMDHQNVPRYSTPIPPAFVNPQN